MFGGRKVIAGTQSDAPKTRQSLLSGEHKMFDAGKSAGPNVIAKLGRACCQGSIRCSTPESPQGRIAGAQSDCCAENSAEPVVRGA